MTSLELTRRKVLGSIVAIGGASAAAGAGTMALFSDTESTTDNTVGAGTLDLTLGGANGPITLVDADNLAPGDSGSGSLPLANEGSIGGSLTVVIDSIESNENGYEEPEPEDNDGEGELDDNLELELSFKNWNWSGTVGDLSSGQTFDVGELAGGETAPVELDWKIPSNVGNEIQGDSVTVDATIELEQN